VESIGLWSEHTGQSSDGIEVSTITAAEDEGGGRVVGGRVLDGVRLAGLSVGRCLVDLESEDGSKEGSARDERRDETHVG
jgi:hypothetical protein